MHNVRGSVGSVRGIYSTNLEDGFHISVSSAERCPDPTKIHLAAFNMARVNTAILPVILNRDTEISVVAMWTTIYTRPITALRS